MTYIYYSIVVPLYHFNSHAHVERDPAKFIIEEQGKHFNSHAHVERDTLKDVGTDGFIISTHTLTWSVR